ncbi:ABC transporter ATP-binding protein [Aliidongia dinghuensis]|uniref:ABC transporter ATP-binding protein n=1 Tax=Aliidongia dinghuensis TaxID=1867774 RepID=A0A8J3E6U5_9PROT|nr:ABC transporter ATP-binding protein [Aliidongia dinghuensis]GGF48005.1 ABC transporter ATP-binding protein [Aliidongia dinghuensis]
MIPAPTMEAATTAATTAALAAHDLVAGYAGRRVLDGVSLSLAKGTVLCLIGHNGAGKSTLMRLLFGLHTPSAGHVTLDGATIRPSPAAMARAGVAYVPEGRGVFPGLTVAETFALAAWSAGLGGGEEAARTDEVLEILPVLKTVWRRRAGQLSGGQQQMVSIGRALLARPSILLLDEPSIGLAPKLFQDLLAPVRALQQARGMSILLVEQNVHEAFAVADAVAVMKSGRVIFEGVPADLADHATLMELF